MSGFANRLPIHQIRDGQRIDLVAGPDDLAEVAGRLALPAIERLEAHAQLSRDGENVRAQGRVKAAYTQSCVVTGDPVAAYADEGFDILFMPQPGPGKADEEIELGKEECDIVFHDGQAIDLGDAVADTLGLSLDPFPRSAGADAALKEAGVLSEEQAGPFAALAQLKRSDRP